MHTSERTYTERSLMLVIALLCGAVQGTCPQFSLTSPPTGAYSCPGSIITYTCVLSSSTLGVSTAWSGSAFQCLPTNQIGLLQRLSGVVQPFTPVPCGSLSAVTTNVTNVTSTCYTSVLTIPAVQALNGATVVCYNGNTGAVVGNDILRIMTSPGPVGNMTVTSTSVDQLTVTWTPPTTGGVPTSYNVTINDSSSPVVIADNGSPVYTHTFTGLVSDTLYTVSMVAINCAGSSNGTSLTKWTLALPPDNTTIKTVSVFNPNNTLRHLEITWTPVGGAVTIYGVYLGGGIHGNTSCTTPQCFYVVPVSVASISYVISVASVNKDGDVGPKSNTTIYGIETSNQIINYVTKMTYVSMATIGCSFLNNQSFYCMVCCSTDPSVPPDSSVYNISTTRGTEVTVSLQGLTSGQMYYCKAAATNTNSNNCAGPVVGGVKVFFSFIPGPSMTPPTPSANGGSVSSLIIGVGVVIIISIIVIILIAIYMTRITGKATITAMCTLQSTVPPPPSTLQNSVGLTERSFQDEVVSREAGQSYCSPGGGYEDIAECYDDIEVVRAVKIGGVASGDRMEPSAVATNTQQATYAIPDQTKKQTSSIPKLTSQEGGSPGEKCAPIGGYEDIVVVRAEKQGGVASGDRMEPSAVATNTQQATYAIPDQTKKASGCGLLLPWLLWICVSEVLSMADTPPPLPAPLKEGDDGLPVAIYALCGPATDDRDVSIAIGCGYLHELTTSFEDCIVMVECYQSLCCPIPFKAFLAATISKGVVEHLKENSLHEMLSFADWERGRPAAWDVTVTSPLTPAVLNEAGMTAGAAAAASEQRKHIANDPKCQELGWVCVPLAVETYGNWGREAHTTFTRLATRLAICASLPKMALPPDNTTIKAVSVFNPNNTLRHLEITWTPVGGAVTICTWVVTKTASRLATSMCQPKSNVLNEIYGRLNLHLTWLLWLEEVVAMQDARREKMARASLPQLPYVSTASGTQTHPSSEHLGSLAMYFRTSAISAAAPTDMLASGRMETDNGDVTVTLKAACLPLSQSNETVCSSLGSRWRSSPVAGVTSSQDESCGADVDKRRALSAAGCPSFNINYPPMRTLLCPGDIITYTCALSSSFNSIITWWTGSPGFQCPAYGTSPANTIALVQPAGAGAPLNTLPVPCGNLSAVMTNISGTCYTSVLTIPTPQYFNGTTVVCKDGTTGTLIGNDTLNIQLASSPGAPSGLQNTSLCTNSLTIQWTPASSGYNASSYNISVTSGTTVGTWSVAGDTTMTTIGDLIDGTNYTVSVAAINCAGSSNSSSVSVQTLPCAPFSVSVTTVLYQNNSVYDVELFWTHRQQSCSVPQYTVMVTSATSTDTYIVANTYCTSSSCLYILGMSGADVSSYNVSVACRNTRNQIGQPYVAMQSVPTPVLQVGQSDVSGNTATIPCTFLDGSSHYCMVCCSPSVPVGLAGPGYLSSTSGPSVSVSLQGLTSGQMYYCKAAATNTNSNNCAGPVVGGVKVFFSFISGPSMTPPTPSANGGSDSSQIPIIIGVTVSVGVFIIIIIVIILIAIYMTRITGKATITAMCTLQSTVPPPPSTTDKKEGLPDKEQSF
eukprot:Em0006g97a